MGMWNKLKNIRIPGDIWSPLLIGAMLGTTMVLFIKLPVAPRRVPTSVENISGRNESLELLLVLPDGEELHLKVTGRTTTEVVQSLQKMLKRMDGSLLLEKSSPYTPHQGVSTMKKHDNFFSMMS
tara:strand:- start:9 stop:383 length:375 start_codon:yes stop_codon:yes gene_type:complete